MAAAHPPADVEECPVASVAARRARGHGRAPAEPARPPDGRLEVQPGVRMTTRFLVGDVFAGFATIPDNSVDLIVSSPPFLALRSYLPADHPDKGLEIGSEATPGEFLDRLLDCGGGVCA